MHVPSGAQNLRTERLISPKWLIYRKLILLEFFFNDTELVRVCLISTLGSFAYSCQKKNDLSLLVLENKLN